MMKVSLAFPCLCITCIFLLLAQTANVSTASSYYKRTLEQYVVPPVNLINQDGQSIDLKAFFNDDKPVILDFIYGTCTTICPILSVGFAHFQKKLGEDPSKVRMISISIDPDNDTPQVMKEYLQKYGARPGWDALTGKRDHVVSVLKEFDAYVANKMNHYPLTILKAPGKKEWVRLYGMLSASDLQKEYERLLKE